MNNIRQGISEHNLPTYMEEILVNNYCPYFLKMSMVHENNDYIFNYRTDRYTKLDVSLLDTCHKLILLRSLIIINERNEDWLIKAENYLIEPELVYCLDNCVEEGTVRMLFYPDNKKMPFQKKIIKFTEKIKDSGDKEEVSLLEKFREIAEAGDNNRSKLFLDKNILRIKSRITEKLN